MADISPLIYIVDDDSGVLRSLERLLRSWGMRVHTFSTGEKFLRLMSLTPDVDCSIIDVKMPGMTGFEIKEELKRSGINVPVIFISAHDEEGIEERAYAAGGFSFLHKPFSDKDLVGMIHKALKKNR